MEIGIHSLTPPADLSTVGPGSRPRPAVLLLYAVGILLVLAAMLYIAFVALNTWLMGQNRYLVADEVVLHSPAAVTWSASSDHAPASGLDVPVYLFIPALGIERSIINLPLGLDERTGTWTQIDTDLRADNGQWKIPIRPDGDWVLVVRKPADGCWPCCTATWPQKKTAKTGRWAPM